MTRKLKKTLNLLSIALIAGLFIGITSIEVTANQFAETSPLEMNLTDIDSHEKIVTNDYDPNGKCGEGKCGSATKESKKESKKEVKSEKKEGKVKTSESKCGEGKCGEGKCGAEKKEGKVEKKEGKTEKKSEGKCGEGKCGVA